MEHRELIEKIIGLEWPMFHQVNGEDRADCQENEAVFRAMRGAQFWAWSRRALECYLADLEAAKAAGRSLVREKYIWMMADTDPEDFAYFKGELPPLSGEQERLIAALWERFLAQTERMREKFPAVALGGRPLLAKDAGPGETSIETYQIGEWKTCSEATLAALLEHTLELEGQGVDLVWRIQENSVAAMGYPTLEAAERETARSVLCQMGGSECSRCGCHFH